MRGCQRPQRQSKTLGILPWKPSCHFPRQLVKTTTLDYDIRISASEYEPSNNSPSLPCQNRVESASTKRPFLPGSIKREAVASLCTDAICKTSLSLPLTPRTIRRPV